MKNNFVGNIKDKYGHFASFHNHSQNNKISTKMRRERYVSLLLIEAAMPVEDKL